MRARGALHLAVAVVFLALGVLSVVISSVHKLRREVISLRDQLGFCEARAAGLERANSAWAGSTDRHSATWISTALAPAGGAKVPAPRTCEVFVPLEGASTAAGAAPCEALLVFTVWRRKTLDKMLALVEQSSIVSKYRVCVTVFQNGNHVDVEPVIASWQEKLRASDAFALHFVQSVVETGYFGRFAMPLAAVGAETAHYWAVFDDDILFGKRYLENAFRVVDEGFLCTRNGRMVGTDGKELVMNDKGWSDSLQVTVDKDLDYDFGGHIWVGRVQWLRWVWQHPPPTYATSEDFWLSAVLKSKYNIGTRTPMCPSKHAGGDIELCACSDAAEANNHMPGVIGEHHNATKGQGKHAAWSALESNRRVTAMAKVLDTFGKCMLLPASIHDSVRASYAYTSDGAAGSFKTSGTSLENCLWWV